MTSVDPSPHMRMAGGATPASQTTDPQLKDVMTSVRQHHHQDPANDHQPVTGTVVLHCPTRINTPGWPDSPDGSVVAPLLPYDLYSGRAAPVALRGMHVVVDIGDAPGFRAAAQIQMVAYLVEWASSVEVRGTSPAAVARVREALADALSHRREHPGRRGVMP